MNLIYLVFMRALIYFLALFVQVVDVLSYYAAFTLHTITNVINSNMRLIRHAFLFLRIKILDPVPYF